MFEVKDFSETVGRTLTLGALRISFVFVGHTRVPRKNFQSKGSLIRGVNHSHMTRSAGSCCTPWSNFVFCFLGIQPMDVFEHGLDNTWVVMSSMFSFVTKLSDISYKLLDQKCFTNGRHVGWNAWCVVEIY